MREPTLDQSPGRDFDDFGSSSFQITSSTPVQNFQGLGTIYVLNPMAVATVMQEDGGVLNISQIIPDETTALVGEVNVKEESLEYRLGYDSDVQLVPWTGNDPIVIQDSQEESQEMFYALNAEAMGPIETGEPLVTVNTQPEHEVSMTDGANSLKTMHQSWLIDDVFNNSCLLPDYRKVPKNDKERI